MLGKPVAVENDYAQGLDALAVVGGIGVAAACSVAEPDIQHGGVRAGFFGNGAVRAPRRDDSSEHRKKQCRYLKEQFHSNEVLSILTVQPFTMMRVSTHCLSLSRKNVRFQRLHRSRYSWELILS